MKPSGAAQSAPSAGAGKHNRLLLARYFFGKRKDEVGKNSDYLTSLALSACIAFGGAIANAQINPKVVLHPSRNAAAAPQPSSAKASPSKLSLTCGTSGIEGSKFLVAVAAGGTPHYSFAKTPLPPGVRFNSAAEQSQGPLYVTDSTYHTGDTPSFDVQVTDSSKPKQSESIECTISILTPPAPGALTVGCPGIAYANAAFAIADVKGGTGQYTYSTKLPLPPPLTLDANTGIVTGATTPGRIDGVIIHVADKDGEAADTPTSCSIIVREQSKGYAHCSVLPVGAAECVGYGMAKNVNINNFWGTNGAFVFFNQIQSIYNGASNSETVSADIGTLNFPFGMQLNIGSNIQAGSAPPTTVSTGTIPTLSPSAAAQAAQNMLYGGTIYASGAYPLLAMGGNRITNPGSWGGMLDVAARQGVDIQSFKSGTTTSLASPSCHSSLQIEGYAQVNSTNLPTVGGGSFAGALFVGGSYGYSYTSHEYIRDYGIAHVNNRLGQLSAGILLNGIVRLAFSKAFGPSQTYVDGTVTPAPTVPTIVNNFKTLSFELVYQSPAPGTK